MRFILTIILAVLVFSAAASPVMADDQAEPGPIEKAGAFIDSGFNKTKSYFTDTAITSRVKNRLIRDEYISGFDIKVSTSQGTVTVTGEVDGENMARRVMAIVRATEGVQDARNELTVVTRASSTVR